MTQNEALKKLIEPLIEKMIEENNKEDGSPENVTATYKFKIRGCSFKITAEVDKEGILNDTE